MSTPVIVIEVASIPSSIEWHPLLDAGETGMSPLERMLQALYIAYGTRSLTYLCVPACSTYAAVLETSIRYGATVLTLHEEEHLSSVVLRALSKDKRDASRIVMCDPLFLHEGADGIVELFKRPASSTEYTEAKGYCGSRAYVIGATLLKAVSTYSSLLEGASCAYIASRLCQLSSSGRVLPQDPPFRSSQLVLAGADAEEQQRDPIPPELPFLMAPEGAWFWLRSKAVTLAALDAHEDVHIRALFFQNASAYSGAESALCTELRFLETQYISPAALVALPGQFARQLSSIGIPTITSCIDMEASTLLAYSFVKKVIDGFRPDAVHFNAPTTLAIVRLFKANNVATVLHLRQRISCYDPALLAEVDGIVCVSWAAYHTVRAALPKVRLSVVHDAPDVSYSNMRCEKRQEQRLSWSIPPTAFVVSLVARFVPFKQHMLLVEAFTMALGSTSAHMVLAGDTRMPEERRLARDVWQFATSHGIEDRIHIVDYQLQPELVYMASDLVVLTSEQEPYGLCVLEALACGVEVLVASDAGVLEVVGDNAGISVFQTGSVSSLATSLRHAFSVPRPTSRTSQEYWLKLGVSATRLLTKFLIEVVAEAKLRACPTRKVARSSKDGPNTQRSE